MSGPPESACSRLRSRITFYAYHSGTKMNHILQASAIVRIFSRELAVICL